MDARPDVVIGDALRAGSPDIKSAGARIAAVLAEQLDRDPHFAVVTILVTAKIIHPGTGMGGMVVGKGEIKESYTIHEDHLPAGHTGE